MYLHDFTFFYIKHSTFIFVKESLQRGKSANKMGRPSSRLKLSLLPNYIDKIRRPGPTSKHHVKELNKDQRARVWAPWW